MGGREDGRLRRGEGPLGRRHAGAAHRGEPYGPLRKHQERTPFASREALVFCAYIVLALAFLWPLSSRPQDTVAYSGDSLATVYFIAENGRRLFTDPLALFDAGIAYPHESAALFEAHRLLPALLAAPIVALTGNPILAVNLLGFLAYAFNGWAVRRLALYLGISEAASFGAGALFAFNTYAVLEQPRLNIILLGFIPLAIRSGIDFMRTGRPSSAWSASLLWLAQAYTENYSAIYGGALIVIACLVAHIVQGETGVFSSRIRSAVLPALLVGFAFLPVALVYARMDAVYDFRREPPYTMDLSHFLATQPGNWLYGKVGPPVRAQQQGAHFIGYSALLLVGFTVVRAALRGGKERWVVLAAAFLTAGLVLLAGGRTITAFGQTLLPGPYGWLWDHVPLFTRTRIPERFGLFAMLPIALLAARGIDLLLVRRSRALHVALTVFLFAEHAQRFPWSDTFPTGSDLPAVYSWLRESDARAVVEAPVHGEGLVRMESVDMYFQLFHRKPVLAAYVSFPPLLTRILRQVASDLPAPEALHTLSVAGVDTIVFHQEAPLPPPEWIDAETRGVIERVASFPRAAYWLRPPGTDVVFRIPRQMPPPEATPAPTLRRLLSPRWRYRASTGRPGLAADGNADTQWIVEDTIAGGESIEIGFGAEPVALAAIAIPLTRRDILPTRFLVETRDLTGSWSAFAAFGPEEQRVLVRDLMRSPGRAVLTLYGEDRVVSAVRLIASPGARSFDGWRMGEVEVLVGPGRIE